MNNIKSRVKSDEGASLSVETILLIGVSVFAVLAIWKYIMLPLQGTAEGIGSEIEDMNPN